VTQTVRSFLRQRQRRRSPSPLPWTSPPYGSAYSEKEAAAAEEGPSEKGAGAGPVQEPPSPLPPSSSFKLRAKGMCLYGGCYWTVAVQQSRRQANPEPKPKNILNSSYELFLVNLQPSLFELLVEVANVDGEGEFEMLRLNESSNNTFSLRTNSDLTGRIYSFLILIFHVLDEQKPT
jgi:hypothetical protein